MIYEAVNKSVLSLIPIDVKRILDVGCGSGALGQTVKEKFKCQVVGITHSVDEAGLAYKVLDDVLVQDLNYCNVDSLGDFDCIICSHILEHLYEPEKVLERLRSNLVSQGWLIVATPNILHWRQRIEFLMGNFIYTNGGLLDNTHFRFFDWNTSRALIENSGFEVILHIADGHFPQPILRKVTPSLAHRIDRTANQLMPGVFGTQFVTLARVR